MNESAVVPMPPPQHRAVATVTPADLLRIAVESNADLDKLDRLMDMQERWQKREAEIAYNEAFAAFRDEAVKVVKNQTVKDGPLKNKKYAELFAVVNAVTPALAKHGLSASWRITKDEKDWIEVTCTIKHRLGFSESVSMGGPPDTGGAKNPIQARASTVSYLERYTLKAICGLAEQDDDDDGNGGPQAMSAGDSALLEAGRGKALEGMKALTTWWKGLKAAQREALMSEFKSLKDAAAKADEDAKDRAELLRGMKPVGGAE